MITRKGEEMLAIDENGEVGFVCDICGKPIDLEDELTRLKDDISTWSVVVWRDGEEPRVVHGSCAHSYNYSVPAYAHSGEFHSEYLAQVIVNWAVLIPQCRRLLHKGAKFSLE
jgi:hypothetical protein